MVLSISFWLDWTWPTGPETNIRQCLMLEILAFLLLQISPRAVQPLSHLCSVISLPTRGLSDNTPLMPWQYLSCKLRCPPTFPVADVIYLPTMCGYFRGSKIR